MSLVSLRNSEQVFAIHKGFIGIHISELPIVKHRQMGVGLGEGTEHLNVCSQMAITTTRWICGARGASFLRLSASPLFSQVLNSPFLSSSVSGMTGLHNYTLINTH